MLVRSLLVAAFLLWQPLALSSSSNNRDVVYKKMMLKQEPYKACIAQSSKKHSVPEWLLMAVIKHEDGKPHGYLTWKKTRKDGTKYEVYDYGLTCISDRRIIDLQESGIPVTKEKIMQSPCYAIDLTAYIIRFELEKLRKTEEANWMTAVGNYHYNKNGKYPHNHHKYKKHIVAVLDRYKRVLDQHN